VPLQIKNDSAACAKSQHTHDDIFSAFVNWAVEPSRSISCEHDVQVSEHSSFGGGLATETLLWLRSIKWPCEDVNQGPLGFASGSSWLELGLSWMLFHAAYVPIIRCDSRVKRLTQPGNYSDALDDNLTLAESGTMVQKMIDNLEALLPEPLLFTYQRGKVSSCYHVGLKIFVQGLKVRLQLPNQKLIMEEMLRLVGNTDTPTQATPKIDVSSGERTNFPGSWQHRQDHAELRMKSVRKIRKERN
jgi:hypothetical protein